MTTICLTQCNTSPSHRVDQVVDCDLCNVGHPCQWVTCPVSMLAIQELGCFQLLGIVYRSLQDPCNMGPCIIMLQHVGDGRG